MSKTTTTTTTTTTTRSTITVANIPANKSYNDLTRKEKQELRAMAYKARTHIAKVAKQEAKPNATCASLYMDCVKTTNVGSDKKVRTVVSTTAVAKALLDLRNNNHGEVKLSGK